MEEKIYKKKITVLRTLLVTILAVFIAQDLGLWFGFRKACLAEKRHQRAEKIVQEFQKGIDLDKLVEFQIRHGLRPADMDLHWAALKRARAASDYDQGFPKGLWNSLDQSNPRRSDPLVTPVKDKDQEYWIVSGSVVEDRSGQIFHEYHLKIYLPPTKTRPTYYLDEDGNLWKYGNCKWIKINYPPVVTKIREIARRALDRT